MTIPSLIFAFLIASLLGFLYHLIRGGGLGRMLLFLIFGWVGFAVGHLVGIWQDWVLFPVGELNLGISTVGSLLFLGVGDWISRIQMGDVQASSDDEKGV